MLCIDIFIHLSNDVGKILLTKCIQKLRKLFFVQHIKDINMIYIICIQMEV